MREYFSKNKESILRSSLTAIICLTVLMVNVLAGRLKYALNDDYSFNFMAVGAYGSFGEYMVYISVIYGLLLKLLYAIVPSINWYLFMMLGLNLVSVHTLCICVCRKLDIYKSAAVSLILNLILAKDFYAEITFTTTASILAIAGLCELVLCLYEFGRLRLIVGTLLIIFAGFIRIECYIMVLPVAALVTIYLIYKNRKIFRRMLIQIGILLIPFLLNGINSLAYQLNPYGRDVYKIESIGDDIIDHVEFTPEEMEIAHEKGFTDSEISLIQNYIIGDTGRYNYARLKDIKDALYASGAYSFQISPEFVSKACFHICDRMLQNIEILAVIWVFVILCAIIHGRRDELILLLGMNAYLVGMYYIFVCWNRVVWRVEAGIWLSIVALFICAIGLKASDLSVLSGIWTIIPAFLILGIYIYNIPFNEVDLREGDSSEFYDVVHGRNDGKKYVTGVYALLSYDDTNIFAINGQYKDYLDKICIAGGWDAKTPSAFARYAEFGVTNPIGELPYRDDLLYAGNEDEAELLLWYFREVYDESIEYDEVEEFQNVKIYDYSVGNK
ncbi:MAG: hypothetical protein IJ608_12855 [Lachnospiraceae bacterium]|nr:hypothetical protein [Lachnospiraceae bacterium]